jgi:hypothetical protein
MFSPQPTQPALWVDVVGQPEVASQFTRFDPSL